MLDKISVKKVFYLDENIKYPICNYCKKELSPFSITSNELKKIRPEHLELLLKSYLLQLNRINIDVHLLFLCKNCLKDDICLSY